MKTFRLKSTTKTALVTALQQKFTQWDGEQEIHSEGGCALKWIGKIPTIDENGDVQYTSQWHADVLAPESWDFGTLEMTDYPATPYHKFA